MGNWCIRIACERIRRRHRNAAQQNNTSANRPFAKPPLFRFFDIYNHSLSLYLCLTLSCLLCIHCICRHHHASPTVERVAAYECTVHIHSTGHSRYRIYRRFVVDRKTREKPWWHDGHSCWLVSRYHSFCHIISSSSTVFYLIFLSARKLQSTKFLGKQVLDRANVQHYQKCVRIEFRRLPIKVDDFWLDLQPLRCRRSTRTVCVFRKQSTKITITFYTGNRQAAHRHLVRQQHNNNNKK